MSAFYFGSIPDLSLTGADAILGQLTKGLTGSGFQVNEATSRSWLDGLSQLTAALNMLPPETSAGWTVMLEYVMPMVRQRIDCVVVAGDDHLRDRVQR